MVVLLITSNGYSPISDSTRKRYLVIASLANLSLRGNLCAIVVKVRLHNTWGSSNETSDFSSKNGSRPNDPRYDAVSVLGGGGFGEGIILLINMYLKFKQLLPLNVNVEL